MKSVSKLTSHPIVRRAAAQLVYTIVFNTIIAGFLTLVLPQSQFWQTFLVSQCIGLTIFSSFAFAYHYRGDRGVRLIGVLIIGSVAGVAVAYTVSILVYGNLDAKNTLFTDAQIYDLLFDLFLALFFGTIILYFFLSREKQFEANQELKDAQLKNVSHQKQIAETQLQLLQAQIEPHFLFNSLANVISLIDEDTPRAKQMLESLTRYLRTSLTRSQDTNGCLKDELDLIENYLKILQIRMGERLSYQIDVDEELYSQPFPIMLLQPVVENSIKHGLEPMADGGEIQIKIKQQDNKLIIQILDNGVGLKQGDLTGFGLMNVRQRLQSLYAESARLKLENRKPKGVQVTIEMPYE